jgi:protein ImuB
VVRCNAAAQACGVHPGLLLPAALSLCAGLSVHMRDSARERRALDELALWAYQFSSGIAFDPSLLLLEIGASLRLFGGLPALLKVLQPELEQIGYSAQHALAPTPTAAGLLARNRPGCRILMREQLPEAVGRLPLSRLTRDRNVLGLIRHIGLDTISDALGLPRPELARRVGPQLPGLLDRLLGLAADPRPRWQPPRHFRQTVELPGEIERATALVFPAHRLMVALCGFLRGQGSGAQHLQWCLQHRDHADTRFAQGLLEPSRDPEHMLVVFRERIERLQLPAPVVAIGLRVEDCLAFDERSLTLLDAPAQADQALLERLSNRLGGRHVRGLRCQADQRPELAWRLCAPGEGGELPDGSARQGQVQPPWLLPQPQPLPEYGGQPQYGGALRLETLPQRIEAGWWDGFDITRDYFVAYSPAGERLWVFRDRRGGGWYLHGLFV